MGNAFNSVRKFYFQDMIAEYDACGNIPLSMIRVFWRAATRKAQEYRIESFKEFTL